MPRRSPTAARRIRRRSTPATTVAWWFSRRSANRSTTEPQAPVLGSRAPNTTRAIRACMIAPAHIDARLDRHVERGAGEPVVAGRRRRFAQRERSRRAPSDRCAGSAHCRRGRSPGRRARRSRRPEPRRASAPRVRARSLRAIQRSSPASAPRVLRPLLPRRLRAARASAIGIARLRAQCPEVDAGKPVERRLEPLGIGRARVARGRNRRGRAGACRRASRRSST